MNTPRLEPGLGVAAALVFATSAVGTVLWCASMEAAPGMEMTGGWTMSMAWMRMPGQGWWNAGAAFVAMWALMMLAMMTPVLVPQLRGLRPRQAAAFTAGYFAVWTAVALGVFPLGVAFAAAAMRSEMIARATPWLAALTVCAAGALQFSSWKARLLACCHREERCGGEPTRRSALRSGARLGVRCVYCCASLNAVLLVIGVMDLRAMALITIAISAERLMPAAGVTPRVIGVVLLLVGAVLFMRAMGA
jgi:predicted metal-binding membrane protein